MTAKAECPQFRLTCTRCSDATLFHRDKIGVTTVRCSRPSCGLAHTVTLTVEVFQKLYGTAALPRSIFDPPATPPAETTPPVEPPTQESEEEEVFASPPPAPTYASGRPSRAAGIAAAPLVKQTAADEDAAIKSMNAILMESRVTSSASGAVELAAKNAVAAAAALTGLDAKSLASAVAPIVANERRDGGG